MTTERKTFDEHRGGVGASGSMALPRSVIPPLGGQKEQPLPDRHGRAWTVNAGRRRSSAMFATLGG